MVLASTVAAMETWLIGLFPEVFFENMTFDDKERIEYQGYYHKVFKDVGKEKVLADVPAWLERHL
jgi:alpha-beta hydrolase superfamily lysophospholipase